jgi:hypothetical protein
MSGRRRALDEDSQGTQSECEESECDKSLVRESSLQLDEEFLSGDEESDLGEDDERPGKKKMKAKYKRKKADWMDVKIWDRQTTEDEHINQEILNIADECMQQCGLPFIAGLRKQTKQPPLGMWPYMGRKHTMAGAREVCV